MRIFFSVGVWRWGAGVRQLLGAADVQTAHPATSSTVPAHQPLGSATHGKDTSNKSTGRSGRQKAATRRNMRREERVTVQGLVKKQQPDGMSSREGGGGCIAQIMSSTVRCCRVTSRVSAFLIQVMMLVIGRVAEHASAGDGDLCLIPPRPVLALFSVQAMAQTGIDALVLVTNHLDPQNGGSGPFFAALERLLAALPDSLPLGLYECPVPYRRLLSDEELSRCASTGRFVVLKDVSCDLPTVTRRVKLVAGTPLNVINANAAIAHGAMQVVRCMAPPGPLAHVSAALFRWLSKGMKVLCMPPTGSTQERPQLNLFRPNRLQNSAPAAARRCRLQTRCRLHRCAACHAHTPCADHALIPGFAETTVWHHCLACSPSVH